MFFLTDIVSGNKIFERVHKVLWLSKGNLYITIIISDYGLSMDKLIHMWYILHTYVYVCNVILMANLK